MSSELLLHCDNLSTLLLNISILKSYKRLVVTAAVFYVFLLEKVYIFVYMLNRVELLRIIKISIH